MGPVAADVVLRFPFPHSAFAPTSSALTSSCPIGRAIKDALNSPTQQIGWDFQEPSNNRLSHHGEPSHADYGGGSPRERKT
jgi:hypothetical protein